jgi:hypothetical protein
MLDSTTTILVLCRFAQGQKTIELTMDWRQYWTAGGEPYPNPEGEVEVCRISCPYCTRSRQRGPNIYIAGLGFVEPPQIHAPLPLHLLDPSQNREIRHVTWIHSIIKTKKMDILILIVAATTLTDPFF